MKEIRKSCLSDDPLLGNNNEQPCADVPMDKSFSGNYLPDFNFSSVTSAGLPENDPRSPQCVQDTYYANVRECASCGLKIWDKFLLLAMDKYWHCECLKCSCCRAQLGEIGTSCFTKGGMILCKNDYLRLFGKSGKCAGCGLGIPANEMVMKVHGDQSYHVNCFSCTVCQHRLVAGDRYSLINGYVLCELDYPKVVRGVISLPPPKK